MKVCIVAPAKSGSTAVYNSIRAALGSTGYCYSFFEPQRPYPLLRLKNYDFSGNFVTKIMASRMVSEKSDFHVSWFDKRIVLVRDIKDLLVSELLFRPMIAPDEVDAGAVEEFTSLVEAKERDPQSISVVELHSKADKLGVSSLNWDTYRNILSSLTRIKREYDCSLVYFEDYSRNDYSAFRQILGMPVGPTNLSGTWVSHIQRKGQSGEWRNWFTPQDTEFVESFFGEYISEFGYRTPVDFEYNREIIDPEHGSSYMRRKYASRLSQMKMLNADSGEPTDREDLLVLVSRARDGSVHHIQKVLEMFDGGRMPSDILAPVEASRLRFFKNVIA